MDDIYALADAAVLILSQQSGEELRAVIMGASSSGSTVQASLLGDI